MEKKWELLGKKHGLGMGKEGIVEMGLGFKKWVLEGSRVKSRSLGIEVICCVKERRR